MKDVAALLDEINEGDIFFRESDVECIHDLWEEGLNLVTLSPCALYGLGDYQESEPSA